MFPLNMDISWDFCQVDLRTATAATPVKQSYRNISKLVTSYIMSYHVISISTHIRKLVVLICLDPIFQVSCPLHLRYLQVNHSKSYSWHSPAWTITRQWAFSSAATEPWVPYWLANPGGSTVLLLCLGQCWPVYAVELCSFSGLIVCGDKSGYWTTYIWISSKYSQPRSQNWPEVGRNKYIYICTYKYNIDILIFRVSTNMPALPISSGIGVKALWTGLKRNGQGPQGVLWTLKIGSEKKGWVVWIPYVRFRVFGFSCWQWSADTTSHSLFLVNSC